MFMMTPSLDQIGEVCRPAAGGFVTSVLSTSMLRWGWRKLISSIGKA
jgi:hypothetical protein